MLMIKHVPGEGWQAPSIVPYGPIPMSPASAVFHVRPSLIRPATIFWAQRASHTLYLLLLCVQYAPSLFEGPWTPVPLSEREAH